MGRPNPNYKSNVLSDTLVGFVDGAAKLMFTGGLLAAVVGIAVLIWHVFGSGNADPQALAQALKYQDYFRQAALWGILAAGIGAAWLFWGEEVSGPILLIVGLALALSSWYLPLAIQGQGGELQGNAITYLSTAGYPAVFIGIVMVLAAAIQATKIRLEQGAKAEQMKYGKGMKEEKDVRNQFLGKCWQLPYCRKFVRERCPIYHAKRTCWKERVGCMCEESVIKSAMENKVISKDMIAASKFIPKNTKLSPAAKAERCRQCVIYNEHQKHKYNLFLPITIMGIAAFYIALRPVLADGIQSALRGVDGVYKTVTLNAVQTASDDSARATSIDGGAVPYNEIILFVLALVALAYAIKVLEFLIWKLKI